MKSLFLISYEKLYKINEWLMVKWFLQVKWLNCLKEKNYSEREITTFKIVLSVPALKKVDQILSTGLSARSGIKSSTARFRKAVVTVGLLKVCFLTPGRDSAGPYLPFKGLLSPLCNVTSRLRGLSFDFSQPLPSNHQEAGRAVPSWLYNAQQNNNHKAL